MMWVADWTHLLQIISYRSLCRSVHVSSSSLGICYGLVHRRSGEFWQPCCMQPWIERLLTHGAQVWLLFWTLDQLSPSLTYFLLGLLFTLSIWIPPMWGCSRRRCSQKLLLTDPSFSLNYSDAAGTEMNGAALNSREGHGNHPTFPLQYHSVSLPATNMTVGHRYVDNHDISYMTIIRLNS